MSSRRSEDGVSERHVPSGTGSTDDTLSATRPAASLDEAVEEYMERCRRGERPETDAFLDRFPGHRSELAEIIEALDIVEEIGGEGVESPDTGRRKITADGIPLDRLGEYRIVREIGRGGMGVVYEAQQDSLRRRVALKVLPFYALLDESRVKRFQSEAQAVAGLGHSNIVPVFNVGEERGIHYYTMQFVEGQPLHRVLREIRALRDTGDETPGADEVYGDAPSQAATASIFFGESPSTSRPAVGSAWRPRSSHEGVPGESGSADSSDVSSATSLSDTVTLTTEGESGTRYFKNIARLGLQVADALSYAHSSGVLHRDIKPSNLLLDVHGKVWVTDFGLAKVLEGDELTHTGDVMGTFAYMAPERFRGWSDPRSDVYSLGVTLYELITLRPAFRDSDRGRLMRKIIDEEAEPPRKLESKVPRDLETIVLKAIEKEPSQRYATAAHMAQDLRLFLDDIPIATRRSGVLERSWRWCRRNPVAAALLLLVCCLSTTALGILGYAFLQRDEAIAAHRQRREATFLSMVHEASTFFRSGEGRRFESLERLEEAARILPDLTLTPQRASEFRETLRSAVLAASSQSDLRVVRRLPNPRTGRDSYAWFDTRRGLFAKGANDGSVHVFRLTDASEVTRLDLGVSGPPAAIRFARPALRLGAAYRDGETTRLILCDLASGQKRGSFTVDHAAAFDFHPTENRVALRRPGGELEVRDTATGELVASTSIAQGDRINGSSAVRYSPSGDGIAVAMHRGAIELHAADLATEPSLIEPPRGTGGFLRLSWHPGGDRLAATTTSCSVEVWDRVRRRFLPSLVGHSSEVRSLGFDATGEVIVTSSWDLTLRLWKATTGRELFQTAKFRSPVLDASQPRIWGIDGDAIVQWEFSPGSERLEIVSEQGVFQDMDFLLEGGVIAYATRQGVKLAEADTGRWLASIPSRDTVAVRCDPRGRFVLTLSPDTGVLRWSLTMSGSAKGDVSILKVGRAERLAELVGEHVGVAPASLDRDGRRLAFVWGSVIHLLDLETGRLRSIDGGRGLTRAVLGPDAHFVATSNWGSREGKVIELGSGRAVLDLGAQNEIHPAFSPDGRWLATATHAEFRFYRTEDWTEVARWRRPRNILPGQVAFFPSGDQVVLTSWPQRPTILDVSPLERGEAPRELATLEVEGFANIAWLGLSADGRRLGTVGGDRSFVWNLGSLRARLAGLGLDWGGARYEAAAREAPPRELRIEVEPQQLRVPSKTALQEERFRIAMHLELERLDRLIAASPDDASLFYERARTRGNLERHAEARSDALRARELGHESEAEVASLLVILACALGDVDAADDALEKLVELPDLANLDGWRLNNTAWAYATAPRRGEHPRLALKLAELAVSKLEDSALVHNTRGLARYRAGEIDAAIADFEKSLANPDNALKAADWILLGMCRLRRGQIEQGSELIERARTWREERQARRAIFSSQLEELLAFEAEAQELLDALTASDDGRQDARGDTGE